MASLTVAKSTPAESGKFRMHDATYAVQHPGLQGYVPPSNCFGLENKKTVLRVAEPTEHVALDYYSDSATSFMSDTKHAENG